MTETMGKCPAMKHGDIRDEIARRIKVGVYTEQLPPLAQLTKSFDAHALTVRKALAALERAGVVERKARVGTFVKRKRRIAFLYVGFEADGQRRRSFHEPVYAPLLASVEEEVARRGSSMMTMRCDKVDAELAAALRNEVDGCVLIADESCATFAPHLEGFPWVRVMGKPVSGLPAPQLSYDNTVIGAMAADYLERRGCRRFVYIGHTRLALFKERSGCFQRRVLELGGSFHQLPLELLGMAAAGRFEAARRGLEELVRPGPAKQTGLYISGDILAASVYQAAHSLGLRLVDEVPTIAGDNNPLFLHDLYPRPPSIDIRMEELGVHAVASLFALIAGKGGDGALEPLQLTPQLVNNPE